MIHERLNFYCMRFSALIATIVCWRAVITCKRAAQTNVEGPCTVRASKIPNFEPMKPRYSLTDRRKTLHDWIRHEVLRMWQRYSPSVHRWHPSMWVKYIVCMSFIFVLVSKTHVRNDPIGRQSGTIKRRGFFPETFILKFFCMTRCLGVEISQTPAFALGNWNFQH